MIVFRFEIASSFFSQSIVFLLIKRLFLGTCLLLFISSSTVNTITKGTASYYGNKFNGNKTASGEKYNKNAFTAAHRTLPFGTMLKVTNLKNNESVVVRVNDRGPFVQNRLIDLSYAAAKQIDMIRDGVAQVNIEEVTGTETPSKPTKKPSNVSDKDGFYTKDFHSTTRPNGFMLQVGSFSALEHAQKRIEELSAVHTIGKAYIQVAIVKKKKVYRVLYGAFETKAIAKQKQSALRKLKFDSMIVSED